MNLKDLGSKAFSAVTKFNLIWASIVALSVAGGVILTRVDDWHTERQAIHATPQQLVQLAHRVDSLEEVVNSSHTEERNYRAVLHGMLRSDLDTISGYGLESHLVTLPDGTMVKASLRRTQRGDVYLFLEDNGQDLYWAPWHNDRANELYFNHDGQPHDIDKR